VSPQLDETMAVWDEPTPNVDKTLAVLERHWHWRVALIVEEIAASGTKMPPALHALFAVELSNRLIAEVEREQAAMTRTLLYGTGAGEPRGILNVSTRHSDTCPVCLNGGHCLEAIQAEWEARQIPAEPEPLEDGMPF